MHRLNFRYQRDHLVNSSKKLDNPGLAPTSILMVYFKAILLRRPTFSMIYLRHRLPQYKKFVIPVNTRLKSSDFFGIF